LIRPADIDSGRGQVPRPVFCLPTQERQNFHMDQTQATPQATVPPTGETAPQAPAAQSAPPEQQAERPVTRKELEDAVETAFRRAQQSSRDRTNKVETEVQRLTQVIQKAGLQVTPEAATKLREQAEAVVDQQLPAAPPEQPGAQDEPGPGTVVYDWTTAYYKTIGAEITKTDPEYQQVKAALDDPNGSLVAYQIAVQKAVQAKQSRIASQSTNADARILGGGTGSGPVAAKNARELLERAHKQ
jgi:hypothetical protein